MFTGIAPIPVPGNKSAHDCRFSEPIGPIDVWPHTRANQPQQEHARPASRVLPANIASRCHTHGHRQAPLHKRLLQIGLDSARCMSSRIVTDLHL